MPRVISGASAGSLIAAILGTKTDDELVDVMDNANFRKDFFAFGWQKNTNQAVARFQYLLPPSFRWISDAFIRYLFDGHSALRLDTEHLKTVIIENVGLYTFQEAFDRTGRIINITVAPLNKYDPPRLLNYLTAPHVCVWSAAAASCAIPGVFDSVALVVKEPNGDYRPENQWTRQGVIESSDSKSTTAHYSDGSIENDLPMQQLSELFNVNHFIVSQVNPHSFLLSSLSLTSTIWSPFFWGLSIGYLKFLKSQCRDWTRNVIDLLVYGKVVPSWTAKRGLAQLLTQDYEGKDTDISIMPWKGHMSITQAFFRLIKNPTNDEFHTIMRVSQRNTWPFIERIKSHCSVEATLDQCVQRLRIRLSNEDADADQSQLAKNRNSFSAYTSRSLVQLSGLSISDPVPTIINRNSLERVNSSNSITGSTGTDSSRAGITKTTSMANFYYKNSSDDLNQS